MSHQIRATDLAQPTGGSGPPFTPEWAMGIFVVAGEGWRKVSYDLTPMRVTNPRQVRSAETPRPPQES
jgi:hypothetical protein